MQVLVVGGSGFFGSHLVDSYLSQGHTVDIIDSHMPDGHNWWALENLKPPRHISWSDISSSALLWENDYDLVVNTACKSLPFGIEHPIQCYQDNVNALLSLIQIIRARPKSIGRLLHISSAEADHPSTFYGAAKASCDLIIQATNGQLNLSTEIRHYKPTNMFGTRQMHRAIIPHTILSWLEGKPVTINGSLDIRRNFVWAREEADTIASGKGSARIWSASIGEILEAIQSAGLSGSYTIGEARAGDYTIDSPNPPPDSAFSDHCRELIDWYRWYKESLGGIL